MALLLCLLGFHEINGVPQLCQDVVPTHAHERFIGDALFHQEVEVFRQDQRSFPRTFFSNKRQSSMGKERISSMVRVSPLKVQSWAASAQGIR